jgi:hypothetical protein
MSRNAHLRSISRWAWAAAALLLTLVLVIVAPSLRVHAGSWNAECDGNNLKITWIGLNTPVSIEVNGSPVFSGGGASGSFALNGPGDWSVIVLENGDLVGSPVQTSCPGLLGGPPTLDPNIYPNGSAAITNVAYKLPDGGFELYMYDPNKKIGTLIFRMTC